MGEIITIRTATFTKKDGSLRKMKFVFLRELPTNFLTSKIKGTGKQKGFTGNKELVWDVDKNNFRVFNWDTKIGVVGRTDVGVEQFLEMVG